MQKKKEKSKNEENLQKELDEDCHNIKPIEALEEMGIGM